MRKTSVAVVALIVLTLAACSASGSDAGSSDGADAPTTTAAKDDPTTTEAEETTTTEAPADTAPVEDWASTFCGNFANWSATIEKLGSESTSDVTPGDLTSGRDAIVALFDSVATNTEDLITSIEDQPTPDIDDGEAFVSDLIGKFQDFEDATLATKAKAADISTSDATAFQSESAALVTEFQTNTKAVGDSFGELDSKYPDPDLQDALTSSCNG